MYFWGVLIWVVIVHKNVWQGRLNSLSGGGGGGVFWKQFKKKHFLIFVFLKKWQCFCLLKCSGSTRMVCCGEHNIVFSSKKKENLPSPANLTVLTVTYNSQKDTRVCGFCARIKYYSSVGSSWFFLFIYYFWFFLNLKKGILQCFSI